MEEKRYLFEFVKDTPAGVLTWHSAPYTGSVKFIVPKGTRGWLRSRMSVVNHYFEPAEGYYSQEWIETIIAKAKEESPIPNRFHGGLSFFISIKTLLGDSVRFLPQEDQDELEPNVIEDALKKEYAQALNCARHEESESFQKMVREGWCSPQMSEEDRKELLKDDANATSNIQGKEGVI